MATPKTDTDHIIELYRKVPGISTDRLTELTRLCEKRIIEPDTTRELMNFAELYEGRIIGPNLVRTLLDNELDKLTSE